MRRKEDSDSESSDFSDNEFTEYFDETKEPEPVEEDGELIQDEDLNFDNVPTTWNRPRVVLEDTIKFQQLYCDYTVNTIMDYNMKYQVPVIRFFGTNEHGNSVLLNVTNFKPYFYIKLPDNFDMGKLTTFINRLEEQLSSEHLKIPKFIVSWEVIKSESIWFYNPDGKSEFVKIITYLPSCVPLIVKKLQTGVHVPDMGMKIISTYESDILFVIRGMIDKGITGSSWLEVNKYTISNVKKSYCQIEITADHNDVKQLPITGEFSKNSPYRILSFDIECISADGHFPSPKNGKICTICSYLQIGGTEKPFLSVCFTLGKTNKIQGSEVYNCESEKELLLKWRIFFLATDCDITTGYNMTFFDIYYIIERSQELGIGDEFSCLGRIIGSKCKIPQSVKPKEEEKKKEVSEKGNVPKKKSQYKQRDTAFIPIIGRCYIEPMVYIQKNHKLRSYTLNSVSSHFLGEEKEKVHHSIIATLANGTDEDRTRLTTYCRKDALLPLRLINKLMIDISVIELSRVTGVPFSYIIERGQQVRVISMLLRKTKSRNYLVPSLRKDEKFNQHKKLGGKVLDPETGYYKDPIATLDFASLYPSIEIANNMCYTTIIKKNMLHLYKKDDYTEINMTAEACDDNGKPLPPRYAYFVKSHILEGIIPEMLKDMLSQRSITKKEMGKAEDINKKNILNGRQLALKISANSIYGFTGAGEGKLPNFDITESTTGEARRLITEVAEWTKEFYPGSKIIYGDSVTKDTPILCRDPHTMLIFYRTIDHITSEYKIREDGKEYADSNLEVWSDKGFTKIKHIIKHKTSKKIYRILTHTGCVDVTEDHSLLDINSQKIKPSEVDIGTDLLHSNLPQPNVNINMLSKEEAWIYGLFFADGYAGMGGHGKTMKHSWKISKQDVKLLEKAKRKLEIIYKNTNQSFEIVDHMKSSRVYNLIAKVSVKDIAIKYRNLFYDDNKLKKVPDEILNSSTQIMREFFDGYYEGDGSKKEGNSLRFDNKGKIGSAALFYISKMIGKDVSINTRKDKQKIFRHTLSEGSGKKKQRKSPTAIKKKELISIDKEDYVYDLETENHHFAAGIGELIVHNTDSIFVRFTVDGKVISDIKQVAELSVDVCKRITERCKPPLQIVFEKILCPFIITRKKGYAGQKYIDFKTYKPEAELSYTGIAVVRRDACMLLCNTLDTILHYLLREKDPASAQEYTREVVKQLLINKIDMSQLVITKSLSKPISEYDGKQIHVELIKKLKKRDENYDAKTFDRISYVVIKTEDKKLVEKTTKVPIRTNAKRANPGKMRIVESKRFATEKTKTSDKGEDPIYALEHEIPIDNKWYLEHQLMKPICSIFTPIMSNPQSLFTGVSTNKMQILVPKNSPMMKFVKIYNQCLKCNTRMESGGSLCENCDTNKNIIESYQELIQEYSHYEKYLSKLWVNCQRCQGELHKEIHCSNNDCEQYYKRFSLQNKLDYVSKQLDRFDQLTEIETPLLIDTNVTFKEDNPGKRERDNWDW